MKQNFLLSKITKMLLGALATTCVILCSYNNANADTDTITGAKYDPNQFTLPYMSAVTVTDQTPTSITLEWNAVEGVSKYEIAATTDLNALVIPRVGTTSDTKFTYSNLTPGTCYQFLVTGFNDSDSKNIKICRTAKGARGFTLINNVENFKITASNDTCITTTWSKSEGAKSYKLYIKENAEWKEVGESTTTKYTFSDLKANTKYEFAIKGCLQDKLYKEDVTILSKDFTSVTYEPSEDKKDSNENQDSSKIENSDSKNNKSSNTNSKQKKDSKMDDTPSTGDTNPITILFVIGTISLIISSFTLIIRRRNI